MFWTEEDERSLAEEILKKYAELYALEKDRRVKELEEWNKQLRENLDASIDDYDTAFKRIKELEGEVKKLSKL